MVNPRKGLSKPMLLPQLGSGKMPSSLFSCVGSSVICAGAVVGSRIGLLVGKDVLGDKLWLLDGIALPDGLELGSNEGREGRLVGMISGPIVGVTVVGRLVKTDGIVVGP